MLDLIVRNTLLPGQKNPVDLGVLSGKIVEMAPRLDQECNEEFDAGGYLVTPPFVDPHFHMDATLSLGLPRFNESGTLLEGIQIWGELKPDLTAEAIKNRALDLLHWSIARGTLAIRTHVDVTDPSLLAVDVLLEVKKEMQQWVDLQLVAFPQDGLLRSRNGKELLLAALDKGVDVVGGIPHFEKTMEQGREATTWLCELAAKRGLQVDMHCDESDDPLSRHIEHLAYEASRTGLGAKVTGSHLTSMHSMDNYYVTKLLPLIAESGVQAICNPLINIHLQGRQDSYPKRRGLTRVPELLRAGINVAFGHDCVMDPWYPMGSHDMLEVAHMGAHCLQMLGAGQLGDIFSMVTTRAAEVMQLEDYGIEVGKEANFVVLQARSVLDAIRLKPARLAVFRKGVCIAKTPELKAEVRIGVGKRSIDFLHG
ncbi:cytosine deaminase [Desulforhopalus sp. IMCC35007]|uniref:cytosine deaminase n=1 Tax=Desulforhopalus sp. IMCC35007 TaxID=2569543 RepID=UPI0010AE2CCF|nr:cytosine deaminase [Desulforhopalus sp. IMCC35007]TKB11775.1 cytosine deaminase [Desulforhopalus sp. IMCC35007]